MKLKEYIYYWFETYRRPYQAPATAVTTLSTIKYHIAETPLGEMDMADIRTRDLQMHLNTLRMNENHLKLKNQKKKSVLSTSVVNKVRQYLISAFRYAVSEDVVARNYAAETQPVRQKPKNPTMPFTEQQKFLFLKRTRKHRYYLAYLLLFCTGCRRSEILGLSWDYVDFQHQTITICQTLIVLNGKPVLNQSTKTEGSRRTLPLPERAMNLLAEWKRQQEAEQISAGDNWKNERNLVFTDKHGNCVHPYYFSRNFKNILRKCHLPKNLRLHSTRHTWATNLIQNNVPLVDIQYLGGWSEPEMLMKVYAHTVKETQRQAITELFHQTEKLLGRIEE